MVNQSEGGNSVWVLVARGHRRNTSIKVSLQGGSHREKGPGEAPTSSAGESRKPNSVLNKQAL